MDLLAVQDLTETQLQLMKFFSIDPWYTRYTGSVTLDLTNFNGWNLKGEGNAIIEFDDLE